MAVYEYECATCERSFEARRGMTDDHEAVRCPACGGSEVRRRFSLFAAGRSTGGAAVGGGGCACGGACACGH